MIALSTLWNAMRHDDGKTLVSEAKRLGFRALELNYRITEPMLADIETLVSQGEISVNSLHNFVPVPPLRDKNQGSGDLFLLSSIDEGERQEAIIQTKRTIEHASRLGARAVVLHLGRTEEDVTGQITVERQLKSLIESGGTTAELDRLRSEMVHRREAVKAPPFEAAFRSLDELNEAAVRKGIHLGIENRAHYYEIPSFEEIGIVLDRFPSGNVGYWHDVGHADIFERMGFVSHREYLDSYGSKLVGIHLHDCRANHDHLAPGAGRVQFETISHAIDHAALKVLEVNSRVSANAIRRGIAYLKERGID